MDTKIITFVVTLLLSKATYVRGNYCRRVEDNCESYTVICSNGIDNLQKNCNNPLVTFVLTDFNSNTLKYDIFSSTSSSFDSTVHAIRGINSTWTTVDIKAFRYYSRIVKLDLSANHIKNISDLAFHGLNALESLNLSRNSIETLSSNTLKLSDSNPTKLHILDLSNNNIDSIASSAFNNLQELTTLYLNDNNLKHIDDNTFKSLSNMSYLSLRNNKLTVLNNCLSFLHGLSILDLSKNYLINLQVFEIIHLESLNTFNASWNAITTVDSNCFNHSILLQTLDLSCNNIQSPIESNMFMNNYRLENLNLFNNSISIIQNNAFKNTMLSYLNIENNHLRGTIGEYTFAGLKSTRLDLSNYAIEVIENYAFSNSPNLVYLNLSSNLIKEINDHGINSLPSLSILDLSNNDIRSVVFLTYCCKNLTELYLQDNKIDIFPENILKEYIFIKVLDLSMNKIHNFGHDSLPLHSLQYFNVQGNILQGEIESGIFNSAKFLSTLDLSNMNYTAVQSGAFNDLPLLTKFNLSHNEITIIDPNNFIGLQNLRILDLSYNQISTLDVNYAVFNNIQSVYLNHNNLGTISNIVSRTNSLLFLDVSYNQIEYISNTPFNLTPNLRTLYLSHNKIESFNNHNTNKLTKLVDLKLSSNKLTHLNMSFFPELTTLDVSNNSLSYIDRHFLQNLIQLEYLDLSNNEIDDLPPGTFHEINGVEYLNFSSNKLSKIRYGSLNDLRRLKILDISRNNIDNLDINLINECTSLEKLIIDYNRIATLDVDSLIMFLPHLNTVSLGGNSISCTEVINIIECLNHTSVQVIAIDKVYDNDNIHGIKCAAESEIMNNGNNMKVTITINFPFKTNPYKIFGNRRLTSVNVDNQGTQYSQ